MGVLEVMQEQIELANLDIALDSLQEAIKTKNNKDYEKYLDRLDFLTKAIHGNVWGDRESGNRIETEIIPLFKKAISQISKKDEYSGYVKESISLRLRNLKGYIRGKGSYDFLDKPEGLKSLIRS